MPESVRAVLVEDHALTRVGLRAALAEAGVDVVGEASDGLLGFDEVARARPDVAVVDLGLPGIDGIELTRRIRAAYPQTRVVVLTMHDLDTEVLAALAAGADAYCVKSADPARVIAAVRVAAEGGAYFDPAVAHVVLRQMGRGEPVAPRAESPLTPRETEILRLVSEGVGNAEIAQRLSLGLGTVKGHVRDILEKLSAADRTQAAVVALRRGLI
ncbi:MAG TPA: response regulator transcription factor [Candidatus Dormibacteraeota bacterium]|nr:response regulator transcription factor [Candidatus Dormibacteraeota bacterium]